MESGLDRYFRRLLKVNEPWKVMNVVLSDDTERTDIYLSTGGARKMPCPECGKLCPIYDTVEREWRHLDLCDSHSYIHADVPRVKCEEHGVKRCCVPWAEPYVGHTSRFEEVALEKLRTTSISAVVREMDIGYDVLHGMIRRFVDRKLAQMDLSGLRRICVDETSAKRGHRYITVVTDADTGKIVFITEGKGAEGMVRFSAWMKEHNGDPEKIRLVSCDFSKAFLSGISANLPNADIVYDRFHLCKMANDALDKVRSKNQFNGMRHKWIRFKLLKNGKDLTENDKAVIFDIKQDNKEIGKAYEMKESLIQLYDYPDRASAKEHLKRWVEWVMQSTIFKMKTVARTVRRHMEQILNWFDHRMSNGFLEGLNGMIQTTKRVGRGFPNTLNFIYMVYFKHGRLTI